MGNSEFQKHLIKLCSDDVMQNVIGRPTKREKATYFLDQVINPTVKSGNEETFMNLLEIMKTTNDNRLKNLVKSIEAGMYINYLISVLAT